MTTDLRLTDREVQVLAGCAVGLTKAEIGRWLWLSENTIKTHLKRIAPKIGARNTHHAVSIAARAGLLDGIDVPAAAPRGSSRPTCQSPVPPGVAERYPSTAWGVREWHAVLSADDDLYNSILRGIGRAGRHTDKETQ